MKRTLAPLIICLALTAGSVWAAGTITVPPGTTQALHADHGFKAVTVAAGQKDITLEALPSPDQIEGVDLCTDHDATKWHPLVEKNGTAITCTYGHEHHADPASMNDIFGPVGAWYGGTQSISYPWQTSSQLGLENHAKHEGYKWYTEREVECRPFAAPPFDGCFRSWRIQVHTMGTASDAATRFHSYSFEAVVEHHGVRGIIRHGGHLDGGFLALGVRTSAGGFVTVCPPLESNPPGFQCRDGGARRVHSGANPPSPHTGHDSPGVVWYMGHGTTQLAPGLEAWGPVDYPNPTNQLLFDGSKRANNSKGDFSDAAVYTDYQWFAPYRDAQGRVTFNGYTDRTGGEPQTACAAPGVDCVPLRIEGVPATRYLFNGGHQWGQSREYEYDVESPVTGKSLIRYPN